MEKQIYKMVDRNSNDFDHDLSFLLKTDCPQEVLEEIEKNAEWIWMDYEKEVLDEEYKQFVPNLYGWSKIEILEEIVKQKGYTWEKVTFPTILW